MTESKSSSKVKSTSKVKSRIKTTVKYLLAAIVSFFVVVVVLVMVTMAVIYPKLPDITELTEYKPNLPLRIYSAEGVLLEEFGQERRRFVVLEHMPPALVQAILATEDARFYEHGGIDFKGILRAALSNLSRGLNQGASTITMQVARNVYLSSERTFARKLYETALTFKLEHNLSKDQILEIYLNHIFLGQRSFGFAAAAETYFGKRIENINVAEAAMLAGLPKSPSRGNPFTNFTRAKQRQEYILGRMASLGFISEEQAQAEKLRPIKLNKRERRRLDLQEQRDTGVRQPVHADFATEMVRAIIFEQFGEAAYTNGFNVYTTIVVKKQNAAYYALRRGILAYEQRQRYRGPEGKVTLSDKMTPQQQDETIIDALAKFPDSNGLFAAVVLEASAKQVVVQRSNNEVFTISGKGLYPVTSALKPDASSKIKIKRGSIVRIVSDDNKGWTLTQTPEVEGALVALDSNSGAIISLVGGFDFSYNKFNHATQAWRQTGSILKPFVYSAALEKGVSPVTVVNDSPVSFGSWMPKNYGSNFDGPMSVRRALAISRNIPVVRVLHEITPTYAQDWLVRFGFNKERHPPYLTLALGAGEATPLQMASAYAVFANGGHLVQPYLVTRIEDSNGKLIKEYKPQRLSDANRVIPERNAFVMDSLLQDVTISGTAARARGTLKRYDIAGKTGTTNKSMDAWFVGYQPKITAAVWVGYDSPKQLGSRETGGSVAMPIWINYMQTALADIAPVRRGKAPAGLSRIAGEFFYDEYTRGRGIDSIGMDEEDQIDDVEIPEIERNKILDLFRDY